MVHGFGEHINRYDRMFTLFAENGIQCYGYDQRGFGQSGKKAQDYGNLHGYVVVVVVVVIGCMIYVCVCLFMHV